MKSMVARTSTLALLAASLSCAGGGGGSEWLVEGRIVDQDRQPAAYAIVWVEPGFVRATADSTGYFALAVDPSLAPLDLVAQNRDGSVEGRVPGLAPMSMMPVTLTLGETARSTPPPEIRNDRGDPARRRGRVRVVCCGPEARAP